MVQLIRLVRCTWTHPCFPSASASAFKGGSKSKLDCLVVQLVKNPPAMRDTWVRSLGWERSGEGKGYRLQYSGLENSMDYI